MRFVLLIIMMLSISSCNRFPEEDRVLIKGETDAVLVVSVPNAGCLNCQRIMESKLQKEKGVKQSILNLHTKEVSIVYEPHLVNPELLNSKIIDLRTELPCK